MYRIVSCYIVLYRIIAQHTLCDSPIMIAKGTQVVMLLILSAHYTHRIPFFWTLGEAEANCPPRLAAI